MKLAMGWRIVAYFGVCLAFAYGFFVAAYGLVWIVQYLGFWWSALAIAAGVALFTAVAWELNE